jgi:hypothetical protein
VPYLQKLVKAAEASGVAIGTTGVAGVEVMGFWCEGSESIAARTARIDEEDEKEGSRRDRAVVVMRA